MPNFHVHWVVALHAIGPAGDEINAGYVEYMTRAWEYRDKLLALLGRVRSERDLERARDAIFSERDSWTDRHFEARETALDAMTCFSAYMLGACGPDFWTLPSDSGGIKPDTAGEHFDLGHYNRTHRQFEVSAGSIAGRGDRHARAEQAYFLGMATHFAADLAIHQLVNVSAGAYNLLKKHWHNEQAIGNTVWKNAWNELFVKPLQDARCKPFLDNAGNQLGLWTTHNKVEHYWDTYVRHRYLGDVQRVFPGQEWTGFKPVGLPTAEGLWRELAPRPELQPARDGIGKLLREPWVKWAIEKPLMLPWLFCERVLRNDIESFIFSRVVAESGAYPPKLVPEKAREEKRSPQMAATKDDAKRGRNRNEKKKLSFFSSAVNDRTAPPHSWNYLTFQVCPEFQKLLAQDGSDFDPRWLPGANVFYDVRALGHFIQASAEIAGKFLTGLKTAYAPATHGPARSPRASATLPAQTLDELASDSCMPPAPAIGELAGFWNLDTGLGIRIENVATETSKEVVTRIDLHHVFELLKEPFPYSRQVPWLRLFDNRTNFEFPDEEHAFPVRKAEKRYASFGEISEPDDGAYLDRILLTEAARKAQHVPPRVTLDEFWEGPRGPELWAADAPTESVTERGRTRVKLTRVAHRLTLSFRAAIADLGGAASSGVAKEKLSLFAVSDEKKDVDGAFDGAADGWTQKYLHTRRGVVLDFTEKPERVHHGLQYFSTRVLLGFETADLERAVERGKWNNVIAENDVGRNISIATGRRLVLHANRLSTLAVPIPFMHESIGVQFKPREHFEVYEDASPTEQLLFTIYPLVRTGSRVYDMFARKPVTKDKLLELARIDAVGFVKLVLLYALTPAGALQLETCYVDGLEVPVTQPATAA